jgi:FkbM family methyltransferase
VTLLAARRVGATGTVYSFEPSRGNLWFLRKHLEWNRVGNVRVIAAALSCTDGSARFGGGSSIAFRLGGGRESVSVRTIHTLLEQGECEPPTFLKIDVEGSEADVLRGAGNCLRRPDLALIVSLHSAQQYEACLAILKGHGFRTLETTALSRAVECGWNGWISPDGRGDPDLIAIGPERQVDMEALPGIGESHRPRPTGVY